MMFDYLGDLLILFCEVMENVECFDLVDVVLLKILV